MNFKNFIELFKAGDSSWEEYPALFERINVAKEVISNGFYNKKRSVKAPQYLTDFGLRSFKDPYLFMKAHCNRLNIELPNAKEVYKELLNVSINILANWIDAIVLVLGEYEVCHHIIKNRYLEIVNNCTSEDLVKFATLCGAVRDSEISIKLFNEAELKAKNFNDKQVIYHRLDAVFLKRNSNLDNFYKKMDEIIQSTYEAKDSSEIVALLDNLYALYLVMIKSSKHTEYLMSSRLLLINAKYILKNAINKFNSFNYELSEFIRYNSQISINQVQLELELKNYDLAETIIKENTNLVSKYNKEYICESLATLAYVLYKKMDYSKSVNTCIDAISEYSKVGGVTGIEEVKKLLVANFSNLKDHKSASNILLTIKADPLGMNNYEQYRITS